jgi:hypothetical protein
MALLEAAGSCELVMLYGFSELMSSKALLLMVTVAPVPKPMPLQLVDSTLITRARCFAKVCSWASVALVNAIRSKSAQASLDGREYCATTRTTGPCSRGGGGDGRGGGLGGGLRGGGEGLRQGVAGFDQGQRKKETSLRKMEGTPAHK